MFRFTIRDLLWLMVVAGLAVGWTVDRRRYTEPSVWEARAEAAVKALQEEGYRTSWTGDLIIFKSPSGKTISHTLKHYPDATRP